MDMLKFRNTKKVISCDFYEINRIEQNSLMYYQGGGENIKLSSADQELRGFYNIDNAYIAINALLMPGISNERVRIKCEKKEIDIATMLENMDELLKVYVCLYSAMCKYTYHCEHEKSYYTYRCDRMNTLEFLENGQMYSFMSTEKYKSNNTDFHDKDGILLLEVEASGNIEHIDVNIVLGDESKYPHEHEILYAPYVLVHKELLEMTEEEMAYRDMHQKPPKAKYLLHLESSTIFPQKIQRGARKKKELYKKFMIPTLIDNAKYVWETFMKGSEPETDAVKVYTEWKKDFQNYLKLCFAEIKYTI